VKPRPYQIKAKSAIFAQWEQVQSTLAVLATGLGKTVLFSDIAHAMDHGRVMVIAHREELIKQAADKLTKITGEVPDIEMADQFASTGGIIAPARCVVASIQTLNATREGRPRYERFNPNDFCLVVTDEAHHAPAKSYRKVFEWFFRNHNCKGLGVTATPDRTDKVAMGSVFESVAYSYDMLNGIKDGWLCPIEQRYVMVGSLDFSSITTTAGDLNGAELAQVMEFEDNLHKVATPTLEIANGRKTLVFASSVKHAERLCEIFNRHKPFCARWVCGETPKIERERVLVDFKNNDFQILVNVGVFTEGFDEPTIEVIANARPTKSRALYTQIVGRGTRTLPGVVDGVDCPQERVSRIKASAKPFIEVIDFVGQAGRHKLVTTADILAGEAPEPIVEAAKELIKKEAEAGRAMDPTEAIDQVKNQKERERLEREEAERRRRERLKVKAQYVVQSVDPFDMTDTIPNRVHTPRLASEPCSEAQARVLRNNGWRDEAIAKLTKVQASGIIGGIFSRGRKGQAQENQAPRVTPASTRSLRTVPDAILEQI